MKKILSILAVIAVGFMLFTAVSYTEKGKSPFDKKMERLYRDGLKPIYHKDNTFYPQAQLDYLDSILAVQSVSTASNNISVLYFQYYKALTLLKLGEEQQSVELLETLTPKMDANVPDGLVLNTWTSLALAYLRLGERNNCINGHGDGSCLFPIRGGGIYTDASASRKSIEIYKDILQADSGDLESRWLLNIACMTLGEYPEKLPANLLIPGLDTDTASVRLLPFRDMAGNLGLTGFRNRAGGSIVDDFNNDGYLDIISSDWGLEESMHFFKNNGDGSFTDVSKTSGLDDIKGGLNIIQADYNNDGLTDIYVLRGAWLGEFGKQPGSLLRNNGDGSFTDVTLESGILSFHPTQTGTWADFNNDGWLDLFIGNETSNPDHPHPSELFMNNRNGTFTNVAGKAGCEDLAFMKGVTSADYNRDGWTDLFISTQGGHKILLKNKGLRAGIPQFEDATKEAHLDKDTCYTFPTWFWDYDNDGWPDIFVSGYPKGISFARISAAEALNRPQENSSNMHLYHNNHDGTFTDVSKETGLDRPVFAMGANFGDVDNDGWSDIYLATGDPNYRSLIPNRMFKNVNGSRFVDVTKSARVGLLQKGHGVAFADLDNDGDLDIFAETGGAFKGDAYFNSLFVNPGQNDNKWISLSLEGSRSNRSAIGAHISCTFTENGHQRTVYRDVNSGGSFGSSPLRQEIGIGQATVIDELTIRWPASGIVQVFKNLTPCQFLKIREGNDQPEKINLNTLHFEKQQPAMMNCGHDMSHEMGHDMGHMNPVSK